MPSLTIIFPLLLAAAVIYFFSKFIWLFLGKKDTPELVSIDDGATRLGLPGKIYPMQRQDILPVVLITFLYGAAAFFGLGDKDAPQTFYIFPRSSEYVQIELPYQTQISGIMYYSGLVQGDYTLSLSNDGVNWSIQTYLKYNDERTTQTEKPSMEQGYQHLFKWNTAQLTSQGQLFKYIRIWSNTALQLGELAIYDTYGNLIPASRLKYDESAAAIFDEQELIPEKQTYLNSTYFDEIYHARTAYENIVNIYPYEVSHPPLGKLIISIGIRIFGMTPFGWRFMGTLFGVLMLPFLYMLIKNMFSKTLIAACGTLLFAFDFMHFTQTRIATIDTYAVFFIILSYLFMYRYTALDRDDPYYDFRDSLFPLFASGLFFGFGAASKWTVIYAGAGLALVLLIHWISRGTDLAKLEKRNQLIYELVITVFACVVFFVIIPAAIYYVSYIPYGQAKGMTGFSMLFKPEYFKIVVDNQKFMFNYHYDLVAEHPYASRWYQWIIDARPILYYQDYMADNMKSAIAAFLNPLVCWGGLFAIIAMAVLVFTRRDGKALFILVGYLSQLVPWIPITRLTFEYHYFPSLIFLVLALCRIFHYLSVLSFTRWKKYTLAVTVTATFLFVAFYPVLSGIPAPRDYMTNFLRWIPQAWPF